MPDDLTWRFANSSEPFQWIISRVEAFQQGSQIDVGHLVPSGFDRYLCLWHSSEGDGEVGRYGVLERRFLLPLVEALSGSIEANQLTCWFAFWHGWGMELQRIVSQRTGLQQWSREVESRASVSYDNFREYLLFTGSLGSLYDCGGTFDYLTPQLWWPEDKSWFVSCDVDLAVTFIGVDEVTALRVLNRHELLTRVVERSTRLDDLQRAW